MTENKIPRFIEEFDIKLLRYIFFRRLWFILGMFIVIAIISFLLLRYTQPIYESSVVLQIEQENRAEKILEGIRFSNEQFSQKIELLHSRVFINRVLKQLPVDVSYYNEGKFLYHDLYASAPFQVHYVIHDVKVYDVPIHLEYSKDTIFNISYGFEGQIHKIEKSIKPNQWVRLPGFEMMIHADLSDPLIYAAITQQKYFMFIIHNPDQLYDKYISNINIQVINDLARTIEIRVRDKNPRRASDLANKIAAEFQRFEIERKSLSANKILEFIDEQIQQVSKDLARYEDSIVSTKRRMKADTLTQQRSGQTTITLTETEKELKTYALQYQQLQSFLDFLNRETIDEYQLLSYFYTLPVAQQLQPEIGKLSELLRKKEEMLQQVTSQSAFIESLNHQIERQKQLIISILKNIQQSISQKYQLAQQQQKELLGRSISNDNSYIYDLRRLERLYAISEQFYNQLIEKKIEMSVLKAGLVPEIIVLKHAGDTGYRVFPDRRKILLLAFVAFIMLSFFVIMFSYLRFNEIISAYEINKYTKVPILGVIPSYPSHLFNEAFIIDKYPQSILAESFRSIRSNLQFIANGDGVKIIAITSTISGEGKTFVALNLASVLAIAEQKVIIIDLDMRKPTLHKFFGLPNVYGMSTLLSNQSNLDQSIQNTGKYSIDVITAGPIPPNPSELINSKQFEHIFEKISKKYHYIIIDTPPIGLVSDALRALQIAHYPIYILRAKFSRRSFIQMPDKLYNTYNLRNTSIILNAFDSRVSNLSFEKDITYSYAYVSNKSVKNVYYLDEFDRKTSIWQKIKALMKK